MKIGEVFRYARPYDPHHVVLDHLPNYFHYTFTPTAKLALLESGINPIQKISAIDGIRCPAILISSSPHKIGSAETPWQDFFDPDNGHIRYFGDNKKPDNDSTLSFGNNALLEQYELHSAIERGKRLLACPIVYFKRVRVGKRAKGNVQFQGFGTVIKVQRVTQFDRKYQRPFTNYVFDFVVFSLADENEQFDWRWISDRRNPNLSLEQCLSNAPKAWKIWVKESSVAIENVRRRVVKLLTYNTDEQKPTNGSSEERTLNEIYSFYARKRSHFEVLAAMIVARIIKADGHGYRHGWITPSSSDGGADFIGRLDIGTELTRAKVIVLGQANTGWYFYITI